jgi:hypothetical protein
MKKQIKSSLSDYKSINSYYQCFIVESSIKSYNNPFFKVIGYPMFFRESFIFYLNG